MGAIVFGDVRREGEPAPAYSQEDLAAYAADKRWRVMCDGIVINGVRIPGDDTADSRLRRARASILDGTITEPIQVTIGLVTFPATGAQLTAIIDAMALRNQAAFAVQAAIVAAIIGGTVTNKEQIENPTLAGIAAWPT
jgi:hypothetical protein